MSDFTDALLAKCRATIGEGETEGKNRSPAIDGWNKRAGAPAGSPWCVSWAFCMHADTADDLGVPMLFPKTAGALKLWHLGEAHRVPLPFPGCVGILDTGDPGGYGHVFIVEAVAPDSLTISSLEGNTNAAGSREGDQVARHPSWRPSNGKRGKLMGFLSFDPTVGVDALPESPFK